MIREIDGESVVLNLETETYYGLNSTATRMWAAMTEEGTVQAALERLVSEYDVEREQLVIDLVTLVEQLEASALLEVRA